MTATLTDWTVAPSITDNVQHSHSIDDLVGYAVVRTDWSAGLGDLLVRAQIALVDGGCNYGRALELVHAERARQVSEGAPQQYAVIDNLYACGCRSDRVTG